MTKENIIKLVDEAIADNPFTEDALALRFSEQHCDDLRYIATKATWLKWDGCRWCIEATYLAFDLARRTCRTVAEEVGAAPNSVFSARTVAAVERMAKADRRQATTIDEWDADDFTLNMEEN